eukprot:GEMP01027417.1.p1 GENE.GEMP01027417.1~~GEMP01027417.1.p1  ORF type:complete len:416 (+),score=94.54 GEMP01027417.1:83-1330(+)
MDLPLCGRCALRTTGISDLRAYLKTDGNATCCLCIGILSEKYIFPDVVPCKQVNVSLPGVITLREALYRRAAKVDVVDIKPIIRGLIMAGPQPENSSWSVVEKQSQTVDAHFEAACEQETLAFSQTQGSRGKRRKLETPKCVIPDDLTDEQMEEFIGMSMRDALARPAPVITRRLVEEVRPYFIAGRYRKLSRELAHSQWIIDGKKKTESSVEEEIAACLRNHIGMTTSKFHSAGREDLDVRMLGVGRPFICEITYPNVNIGEWTSADWQKVEASLPVGKSLVEIRELRLADKTAMEALRIGAEQHEKTYVAVVHVKVPNVALDALNVTKLPIFQKTPVRVLHRRSNLLREKEVIWMKAERLTPNFLELRVHASAGMYIKEFIHGDFGRTRPSVSELLKCECDIIQLDVENLVDP